LVNDRGCLFERQLHFFSLYESRIGVDQAFDSCVCWDSSRIVVTQDPPTSSPTRSGPNISRESRACHVCSIAQIRNYRNGQAALILVPDELDSP
jgi:hypothetical protein